MYSWLAYGVTLVWNGLLLPTYHQAWIACTIASSILSQTPQTRSNGIARNFGNYIPLMMLLEAGKLPRHFLTLSTFFITFLYHSCVLISRFVGHNSHARASHTIHRRLPECFLSFAPPEDMLETEVVPSPCLQNGHVSFGNFNNFSKTRFVSKRPKINSQKRWSCLVLVLARAMVKSARPVLSRWPTVPDCVQGAEPDVVPCHRCNHPCRNAVVCLFAQNMFFENKKSWKSSKNKNSC